MVMVFESKRLRMPYRRKTPRCIAVRVFCLALIVGPSCGTGDGVPIELKIRGAAALEGEREREVRVVEIPDLTFGELDELPIAEGIKTAQSSSAFGGAYYRTCALQRNGVSVVPVYCFRLGGYAVIRFYVENTTGETIDVLTDMCQLRTDRADKLSSSDVEATNASGTPKPIVPVVVGFSRESQDYVIVDNGDGTRQEFDGILLSGYGIEAYSYLGCKPYSRFKKTKVRQNLDSLQIPAGEHAVVNLCYVSRSFETAKFDLVMQMDPQRALLGFRILVGRV